MQVLAARESNAIQKTQNMVESRVRRIDGNIYKIKSFKDRKDNGWYTLIHFRELDGIVLCSCEDFFYNRSWQEPGLGQAMQKALRKPEPEDKYKGQRYCKHTYFFMQNMDAITSLPITNMPDCPACSSTKIYKAGHSKDGRFDRFYCYNPEHDGIARTHGMAGKRHFQIRAVKPEPALKEAERFK